LIEARPGCSTDPVYLDAISEAAGLIRQGGLVGFPTETVYGLGADALNPRAVARVYVVKQRPPESALILHLAGPEQAEEYLRAVPEAAWRLMRDFWPGPLTLVLPKAPIVPAITSGGRDNIAVRVPDHPVAIDFIRACGRPVVGPSANKTGRPSPMTAQDVLDDLGPEIEAVLDAGPAPLGMESTVLDMTIAPPAILRPGSVTAEELEPYLGPLSPPPNVPGTGASVDLDPASRPFAARLVLVDVPPGPEAAGRVWELARDQIRAGRRPGLLMTTEGAGERAIAMGKGRAAGGAGLTFKTGDGITVAVLGPRQDPRAVAGRLYAGLRALERLGCDVVLAEPVPRAGLGAAVMNRLEKAADEVVSS